MEQHSEQNEVIDLPAKMDSTDKEDQTSVHSQSTSNNERPENGENVKIGSDLNSDNIPPSKGQTDEPASTTDDTVLELSPLQNKDSREITPGAKISEDISECAESVVVEPTDPKEQTMDRDTRPSESKPVNPPNIPSTNIGVAILVSLCFNLPFGALAIYFSLMATKAYRDGKPNKGEQKARISVYISLFSIVLTVLIVMAVVLMQAIHGHSDRRRYATKTSIDF